MFPRSVVYNAITGCSELHGVRRRQANKVRVNPDNPNRQKNMKW